MTADDKRPIAEDDLDALLRRASEPPRTGPSEALFGRIMADARDNVPRPGGAAAPAAPRRGFWAAVIGQIGGLPGAAGLVAAGLAGVMIGYADPGLVNDAGAALGLEAADYGLADFYAGYPGLRED